MFYRNSIAIAQAYENAYQNEKQRKAENNHKMDSAVFRKRGKEMVDYIADYLENVSKMRVTADVEPGYMRDKLPASAPKKAEDWVEIMKDVNEVIMPGPVVNTKDELATDEKDTVMNIIAYSETINVYPYMPQVPNAYRRPGCVAYSTTSGVVDDYFQLRDYSVEVTHWQHPHFHAYFPAGNSYPSILGDMLSDALGVVGFSWAASPACTELEMIVLDWVGKMIGLPGDFIHENGMGGGVIQGSASECILVTLLAARHTAIRLLKIKFPFIEDGVLLSKLIAYSSKLAHSCVEKAGMISFIKMRQLEVDENFCLRGSTLQRAIDEDRRLGLIPFFACATLGTTACCSFDNIQELGEVCSQEAVWLHVDAAYAGSALICPEFQYLLCGIENANSFNFNANKWMLVNFDCSLLWVKDKEGLTSALTVDPLYLQHHNADRTVDFRHWGIPLSRRFRSLKLWFVIRAYGVEGLQKYIREHVRLAKVFEKYVLADDNYEVLGHVTMGLVCFRLKGPNSLTQKLLRLINESGTLHMIPALVNDRYVIRFAICSQYACTEDVTYAWKAITALGNQVLIVRRDSNRDSEKTDTDVTSEEEEDVFSDFEEEICFDQQRGNVSRAKLRRSMFQRMTSEPHFLSKKLTFSQSIDLESKMHCRRQSETSAKYVSTPDYTFGGSPS